MAKIYHVDLTEDERTSLLKLIKSGKSSPRKINRARILLLADEGKKDQAICEALHTSISTVERTRKKFVEGGLEYALNKRPRPGGRRKLDCKQEAFLVALVCSEPPEGRKTWTMQLLADKLVELGIVDEISDETVCRTLKNNLKPWLREQWCIPKVTPLSPQKVFHRRARECVKSAPNCLAHGRCP